MSRCQVKSYQEEQHCETHDVTWWDESPDAIERCPVAVVAEVRALAEGERCESFVAPHACTDPHSGRKIDAPYEADRYCLPCRLRVALDDKETHR